jgi:hypothetical protein
MKMPTISRDNQATHVDFGFVECWFSYETLIAFRFENGFRVVSENCWSQTTGKHLNAIEPDKSKRVDRTTFVSLWTYNSTNAVKKAGVR